MRVLSWTVPEEWDGALVRSFARGYLQISSSALKAQKYPGGILINGQPRQANAPLRTGDLLSFPLRPEKGDYPPAALPIAVIYEDEDYILVDKPPGMPIHPSPGHDRDSLLNAAAEHYRSTGQQGRIRPLYRLDRDTSGLVLIAKSVIAAGARLEKEYWAVCEGILKGSGTVDCPIGLAPGSRILRSCKEGRRAVTHWQALAAADGHTLLALRLETGRTHQIRVHMAHIGRPLAGDDLYGGSRALISRQALHMGRLAVVCPALGMDRKFCRRLPEDMRRAFPWAEDCMKEDVICPLV